MRSLSHALAAAFLLLTVLPAPGRGCAAASCPGMSPAHPALPPMIALAAPAHDCCRVRAERSPVQPARLLEPPESATAPAAAVLPSAAAPRPEPRPVPAPRWPVRSGPPLYTLLATLLI
jgi:hypothetical protein